MKRIVQVIPNGQNSIFAISGVSTIMGMAQKKGLPIDYSILSAQDNGEITVGAFSLQTDGRTNQSVKADIIIIPSIVGEPDWVLRENKDLILWLIEQEKKGAQLVSLCTGAYLLAATGLLNNKEASSHCEAISDLRRRFPLVKWVPEKIITDHAGIYTSGGTISSFNVLIYLLEKFFDKQIANNIAKIIQLEYPRKSQKPFYIFANQRNHRDEKILAIQDYLENQVGNPLNLNQVARRFGISRRSLNRKFKEATGDNPQTYIQKARIEQAKVLLESDHLSINEVIYEIGYSDGHSFRKLFRKVTGLLPSEYRKKYSR